MSIKLTTKGEFTLLVIGALLLFIFAITAVTFSLKKEEKRLHIQSRVATK